MNVRSKILVVIIFGCALCAQSAIAATIVAASDASASSKATAQYICDGSSDQVELNQALARGGEVIMTEGTFRTSGTVYVKGGNVFRGQGADKTVLSMAGDYAARVDIAQPSVTVSDFKITQRGWLMITTSNVKVHDVTIQDSKRTAPTVNGMFFVWADGRVCENIEFVRCKAIDVGSTGFNLNGQKSPRVNRNIRFESCEAIRCGNEGSGKIWAVGFDFHEGADLYDLTVNNCYAEDNWESGFYFEPNFYNGNDPNTAIPVQVNSRVTNCKAVNNGWRNTEPTRFYMTGYYLSCGVTLNNCQSKNNKNNGFWIWQGAKDVILNSCTDEGSDKSFQVRTGTNLKFNKCVAMNSRTYALYAWGTSGAVFDDFRIVNPKKTSGAVSLGLREDHPNDPWPVTGCKIEILLTGANPDTLIRYYNAQNNLITINGDPDTPPTTLPITTSTTPSPGTQPPTSGTPTQQPGQTPFNGPHALPGTVQAEDFDNGGQNVAYWDSTTENKPLNTPGYVAYRPNEYVDAETINGISDIGWITSGEWLEYTVDVPTAGTYTATFRVASWGDGRKITVTVDGAPGCTVNVPNTGSSSAYQEVPATLALSKGTHVIRLTFTGSSQNIDWFAVRDGTAPTSTTSKPSVTSTAIVNPGTGAAIPGLIEAENYNTGGEGVAYHDTTAENEGGAYRSDGVDIEMATREGSHVVGWVRPGEWLKYSVNVAQAGVYDVSFRVSSQQSDASFKMQVDNNDVCTVMVPNTGSYLTYTTVVQQVSLPAGSHVVRLYFNGYTNVNWMKFQTSMGNVQPTITSTTPTTTATAVLPGAPLPAPLPVIYGTGIVPGVIQAEDFNTGGEGVGYYDTTASNFGGIYRNEDVDIELNDDGNPVVCWIRPGEWLKYTVNVRWTGDYDVVFRVSSPSDNTQMRLQVDGVTATTFTVPNTGSYDSYTSVTKRFRLTGGPHVIRLVFGGYQNIDFMSFAAVGTPTASRGLDVEPDTNMTAPMIVPVATATVPMTPNATTPGTNTTIVPVTTAGLTDPATPTPANNTTTTTTPTASPTEIAVTATPAEIVGVNTTTPSETVTTASGTTAEATTSLTPIPSETALETTVAATPNSSTETPTPTVVAGATETTPPAPFPAIPADETTVVAADTPLPATPSPIPTGATGMGTTSPPATTGTVSTAPTVSATPTPTAIPTVIANTTPTTEVPRDRLMQVVATDRNLSTFVRSVQEAGLLNTLDGVGPYTIFAPTDEAFQSMPPGTLEALLSDPALLGSVIRGHVADGQLMAADLVAEPEVDMVNGEPIVVTANADGTLEIGGSPVNRTDVLASNGVIHVIDRVILPPDVIPTPTTVNPTPATTAADVPSTSTLTMDTANTTTIVPSPISTDSTSTPTNATPGGV